MNKNLFAPTPPMGWNSYDYYDTTVNEAQVKTNADYMAANLKDYGWEYIVVDIQWYAYGTGSRREHFQYIPFSKLEMDDYGRLLPCPEKFPSAAGGAGFKPLSDYIHSLGLKFGIHIMRGIPRIAAHHHLPILGSDLTADMAANPSSICGWNPDMYGLRRDCPASQAYYDSIFALYAAWGVDYVKCDDICNTNLYRENQYSAAHEIEMLHNAIEKCGRPIVLSLSPGPALIDKAWHYEKYANMWRITDDFWDHWDQLKDMFHRCELWQNHVNPGCFPDCDMLPLGKVGGGFGAGMEHTTNFTRQEQVTMMTLWCTFRAPLMLGAEMTKMDDWTLSLLTNKDVLSLLSSNRRGLQIFLDEKSAVWVNFEEKSGNLCIALFNLQDVNAPVSVSIQEIADMLPETVSRPLLEKNAAFLQLTELWSGETRTVKDCITENIDVHGSKLFRIG